MCVCIYIYIYMYVLCIYISIFITTRQPVFYAYTICILADALCSRRTCVPYMTTSSPVF